jgi:cytochrome c-type biogenesis protein CcmH/NrfF
MLSVVPVAVLKNVALLLWLVVIVMIVVDSFVIAIRLRKQLNARFPEENTKGAVRYALMRTLQMRRLRLPKPQVKRGERP